MVSFLVRMRFAEPDLQQVTETLHELAIASRKEPGCVTYIAHTLEADPAMVVIYEQYTNQAALDFHRSTPHFQRFAVGGLYQLMREREIENLRAME
jgi:quinol monooxygenase YgiN